MSEFFLSTCKENRVPTESKKLFKDMSLAKFLVGKVFSYMNSLQKLSNKHSCLLSNIHSFYLTYKAGLFAIHCKVLIELVPGT